MYGMIYMYWCGTHMLVWVIICFLFSVCLPILIRVLTSGTSPVLWQSDHDERKKREIDKECPDGLLEGQWGLSLVVSTHELSPKPRSFGPGRNGGENWSWQAQNRDMSHIICTPPCDAHPWTLDLLWGPRAGFALPLIPIPHHV